MWRSNIILLVFYKCNFNNYYYAFVLSCTYVSDYLPTLQMGPSPKNMSIGKNSPGRGCNERIGPGPSPSSWSTGWLFRSIRAKTCTVFYSERGSPVYLDRTRISYGGDTVGTTPKTHLYCNRPLWPVCTSCRAPRGHCPTALCSDSSHPRPPG